MRLKVFNHPRSAAGGEGMESPLTGEAVYVSGTSPPPAADNLEEVGGRIEATPIAVASARVGIGLSEQIGVGRIFRWQGRLVKVISQSGVKGVVRFAESGLDVTVDLSELRPVDGEGYQVVPERKPEHVPEAEWKIAERRRDVIVYILANGLNSNVDRRNWAAKLGIEWRRLAELVRIYLANGTTECLLSRKPGRKLNSVVISDVQQVVIGEVLTAASQKLVKISLSEVHRDVNKALGFNGLPEVSKVTVDKFAQRRNLLLGTRCKHGAAVAMEHAARYSGTHDVDSSLAEMQIDHTLVDMICVDNSRRYILGRPWLTLAMDVHSRAILGFYVSFRAPSMVSVAMALTMAAIPKRDLLYQMGLSALGWNVWGIPRLILTDRAREFRCKAFISACDDLKIDHQLRPIGKKHWGGHIERLIGTMMGELHLLPGSTMSNPQMRKSYNAEAHAIFTLGDLVYQIVNAINKYMHSSHRPIDLSPQQQFLEGLPQRDGQPVLPPVLKSVEEWTLKWLPRKSCLVRPGGLYWANHRYENDDVRALPLRKKVEIAVGQDSRRVLLLLPGEKPIEVPRKDKAWDDNIDFESRIRAARREAARSPENLAQIELSREYRDIRTVEAKAATTTARARPESDQDAIEGEVLTRTEMLAIPEQAQADPPPSEASEPLAVNKVADFAMPGRSGRRGRPPNYGGWDDSAPVPKAYAVD